MSHGGESRLELDLTLRRFWRLLEFTRDIDRSEHDWTFARAGGRINYIFDENLFEMFIGPFGRSRYVELFHTDLWDNLLPPERRISSAEMRRVSAQSALVTSEYLFSGQLTGQVDRAIYMTEWHFRELSYRREQHIAEFKNQFEDERRSGELQSRYGIREADLDDLTQEDIEAFAGATTDAPAVARFREARLAARNLTEDRWELGPAYQLKRISSRDIVGHIVPLAATYRPSPVERRHLVSDRQKWLERLQNENRRRSRGGEGRPSASLQNDADALTYISWIARQKAGKQDRFVFVTGDTLVFDVYREWYIEQPIGEPFVMRRISQYLPMISMNEAPTDVINRRELFRSTREALEAALFVFNLSGFEGGSVQFHKGREHLALNLLRYLSGRREGLFAETFISRLTTQWMKERNQDFGRLVNLWQKLERFLIGVNHDLIMRRSRDQSHHKAAADSLTTDGGAFTEYLRGLLNELVSGSIELFFPFASAFIGSIVNDDAPSVYGRLERVPIALRLCVPNGSEATPSYADLNALLDAWHRGDKSAIGTLDVSKNPSLAKRPDLVYAIASALALAGGEWRDAERFSDLARSAEPMTIVALPQREDSRFECLYLYAVARRFRLATLDPAQSRAREDVWHRMLDSASLALTQCEFHHARKGEIRRQVRAISERGALRLFYAGWAAVTPIDQLEATQFQLFDAIEQLRLAIGDFRRCLELEATSENIDADDTRRQRFFDRIRLQYTTNLAAFDLVADLLQPHSARDDVGKLTDRERQMLVDRINNLENTGALEKRHKLARVVLVAFRARETGRIKWEEWQQLIGASARHERASLPLDDALVDSIGRMLHGQFA